MDSEQILRLIEAHSEKTGLGHATICQYAVKNSALYGRLKAGGECLPRTASRLREWIEANSQQDESAPADPAEDAA